MLDRPWRDVVSFPFWNAHEGRLRAGWRVLSCLTLFLFGFVAVGVLTNALLPRQLTGYLQEILFLAAVLGAVWVAARYLDRRAVRAIGFGFDRGSGPDLLAGCAIGAAIPLGVLFAQYVLGWLSLEGPPASPGRALAVGLSSAFGAVAIAAIAEEVLIRGYVLKNLAEGARWLPRAWGITVAWIGSAVIFAWFHSVDAAAWHHGLHYVVAGMLLALPVLLRGDLAMAIGLHVMYNFTSLGLGLRGPGGIIVAEARGPGAWVGTAGLLETVVVILATVPVLGWICWRSDRGVAVRYLDSTSSVS